MNESINTHSAWRDGPLRYWAILTIMLAIAMRMFALYLASDVPHIGDPDNYVRLAEALDRGQGLALPRPANGPWIPTATFPPVLPVLLAGIGLVHPLNASILYIFNSLIDVAAAMLLARLATQLGRRDLAIPLALAYLVWPSIALMAPLAYKESLLIALLLATLVSLVEQSRHSGVRWAVVSGLAAGATMLTQPAVMLFLPLSFVALKPCFKTGRRWLCASLLAASVAMLCMVPWWARNAIDFRTFIPLTTSGGPALWQGAHPAGGMQYQPQPESWANNDELTAARLAGSAAWQFIIADPIAYIGRALVKFPSSFLKSNWAIDQLVFAKGQPLPELARSIALRIAPTLVELCVVVTASIGLILAPRSLPARLLWAGIAQIMLFGIWFEFSERHRAFLTPFILLMAAAVVSRALNRRGARRGATIDVGRDPRN